MEGHKLKQKIIDEQMWLQGKYNFEAFSVALSHFGAGLNGKKSNAKYLDKPILQISEKTEKNNQEEVAVFEMKKRTKMLEKNGLLKSPT